MEDNRPTDVITNALEWLEAGHGAALATVVKTWGSSPCPVGSQLAVRDDSLFLGSVSGGCIEGEVVTAALAAIRGETCTVLDFGISDEDAWQSGLACGGEVRVAVTHISSALAEQLKRLQDAREQHQRAALTTDLGTGGAALYVDDGEPSPDLAQRFLGDCSGLAEGDPNMFIHVFNPPLRLFIVGAVHIAQALARIAAETGYGVVVIDPRDTWATDDRFPNINLDRRWPSTALADAGLDSRSAVITLCHDPKLDDPALVEALKSDAFYVGSLGSRRTHAKRLDRLRDDGVSDDALARIHGPLGLDIGAQSPAEIALSAMAQVTAALRGKS